jgi:hypothetical protein
MVDYHTSLIEMCDASNFNVQFKGELQKFALHDMKPLAAAEKRLRYLGMEFSCGKRSRNDDRGHIQWRHDSSRLARWQDVKDMGLPKDDSYRTRDKSHPLGRHNISTLPVP